MGCDVEEFRKIILKSKKNNTYKFALAKFLLDYSKQCIVIEDKKIDYEVIAKAFLDYYWILVSKNIKQVSDKQSTPIVVKIIKNYSNRDNKNEKEIIREIAKDCFKDVIPRFQYKNNSFYSHYHELQGKSYKMPSDEERHICLFKESIEFFRDNYEELNIQVTDEWDIFLRRVNGALEFNPSIFEHKFDK